MAEEFTVAPPAGEPNLEEPPDAPREPEVIPGWSEDAVHGLLVGLFAVLASVLGPHWAITEEEAKPLAAPLARQLNRSSMLAAFGGDNVDLVVLLAGFGTIISKRIAQSRSLAKPARPAEPSDSPYGRPNHQSMPPGPEEAWAKNDRRNWS